VRRVLRHAAGLVSRAAMTRRFSGAIGAAEGSRARSSPEAAGVPPSSSPANCAAPASRRLRRVPGGSPKVARPIISSRRSMRRSGQLLVGSAGPRTSTPQGGPRAGDGDAAPGQTRSVPPGYDAKAKVIDKYAASRWHRVRDVRGTEMRGTCSLCGDVPVRWNQPDGRFVCASSARKRQHADRERWRRRLALYGLSMDDYERMAREQGQRCAICRGPQTRVDSDGTLVVDHDHKTGTVRGLLCGLCNTGLGAMRDNPAILLAAIRYLRASRATVEPLVGMR
jgi:hypothetical protein